MFTAFFNNTKIRSKILVIALVPLLGLITVASLNLTDKSNEANEMDRIAKMAELAPVISGLVHELQKERGMSAGFVASKGEKFKNEIGKQRELASQKLSQLETALSQFDAASYGNVIVTALEKSEQALGELEATRRSVSQLSLTVPEMAKYYTGTIGKLLLVIKDMSLLSSNAEISRQIIAYTSFLEGKERAGQERAVGAGGYAAQHFSVPGITKFISLIAAQDTYLESFTLLATPTQVKAFNDTRKSEVASQVNNMRTVAINSILNDNLENIQANEWFDAITAKINLLKNVEDRIASDLYQRASVIQNKVHDQFNLYLVSTIALLLITAVISYFTITSITRHLKVSTQLMSSLANGNTEITITGDHRRDEIGDIARALTVFKENKLSADLSTQQQMEEQELKSKRAQFVEEIALDFDTNVTSLLGKVSAASSTVSETGQNMKNTAQQTNTQASSAAEASNQASSNVQTVATASDQLSASISEISRQLSETTTITTNAVNEAQSATIKVKGLEHSAKEITNVASLISDIAEQTNMLALNATIEAARAGEAGKGFAVVASEVKALAKQTAQATEQISQQIKQIQQETNSTVYAIDTISSTIRSVNEITASVASAVEEQGAATAEIARNIEAAARGTESLSQIINEVNQGAEETGSAANVTLDSANSLTDHSVQMRDIVESFLRQLKTA